MHRGGRTNERRAVVYPRMHVQGVASQRARRQGPAVTTAVTMRPSLTGAGRRATRASAWNDNGQRWWSLTGAASGAEGPAFESRLAHKVRW